MRQGQVVRLHLRVAVHQKVQVDDARTAHDCAMHAAHLGLDGLQRGQQPSRSPDIRGHLQAHHGVIKPGLVLDLALGLGAVDLGLGLVGDVVSVVLQQGQGLVDVRLGVADVGAQRDICG